MHATSAFAARVVSVCGLDFPFIFRLLGREDACRQVSTPSSACAEAWLGITTARGFPDFDRLSHASFLACSPVGDQIPSISIFSGSRLALTLGLRFRAWRATTAPPRDLTVAEQNPQLRFIQFLLASSRCLGLTSGMSAKEAGRGEFSQLVADHVFRDEQLEELPAVVNQEGVADKIRHDGAIPRPRLQRLTTAGAMLLFHFAVSSLSSTYGPFFIERVIPAPPGRDRLCYEYLNSDLVKP